MFCKEDEGPEDEEGSGLVIGIWQWLITKADVMFLRLDWKLARIPCGLNGHWALSWKGEETQRGPHRMATGFVNNHTSQLAPVTAARTTTLDWTVTGNKTGLHDNRQLSGWTEKLKRFPKPTLHGNRDPEYCLLPIYPRPLSESQETITSEKHALQTEMVREGPILLSVSSPWPYQLPAHSRCFKRRTNWVWWN